MLITLGSSTDLGRRETNQDSVLAILAQNLLPKRQLAPAAAKPVSRRDQNPAASYVQSSALLILADGMGGRASGQLASETAAKSVYRELAHTLAMQDGVDAPYLEKALDGAIQQANNRIHQLAAKKAEAEGMGTTCTAALVMYDMICIGHVGDSRAYLCSGLESDEPMHRDAQPAGIALLTADHSVVAGEVRAGRLTEEEARLSRFRNVITRAVGVDLDVEPDVFTCPVPEGGYRTWSSPATASTAAWTTRRCAHPPHPCPRPAKRRQRPGRRRQARRSHRQHQRDRRPHRRHRRKLQRRRGPNRGRWDKQTASAAETVHPSEPATLRRVLV